MAVYWSACLASVLFTWFALHVKHEKEGIRYWLLVTFVAALPLIYISAIRYNVGADYAAYYKYYNRIVQGGDRERFEILYYLLNKGIALLHMSAPWMFAACAMLFLMPLYKMILSDSPYPYFSIFLLIATGYYFFFLNGTRQMIGAAIFMLAIPYIEKKNILPFIVLTLLSTGFHTMSIAFIATYAFSIWRIDNRFLLIVTGGLILLSNVVAGLFNNIIGGLDYYSLYLASSYAQKGQGLISLIMSGSIVAFATVFYQKNNTKYQVYYNMQVIAFWVTIMTGKVVLIERFRMSFGLSSVIFIPMILNGIKNRKTRRICGGAIGILYFFYVTYTIGVLNGNSVLPYQTIFSVI